jgi:hypothetical protein
VLGLPHGIGHLAKCRNTGLWSGSRLRGFRRTPSAPPPPQDSSSVQPDRYAFIAGGERRHLLYIRPADARYSPVVDAAEPQTTALGIRQGGRTL